jgi:Bax protein
MRFAILLLVAGLCLASAALLSLREPPGPPLPDFAQWPAGEPRKERFFAFLRPLLQAENARLLGQRQRLEVIAARTDPPTGQDARWLRDLAKTYDLAGAGLDHQALITELLLRVDAVPASLGLAQAAKESGWGTSRFARNGNALFGQRCFEAGCGLVPENRRPGLGHEVRDFPSPQAAVASYLRNLNSHRDYEGLRRLRAQLRARGAPATGFLLARTLGSYSERGDDYVQEIRQLIRFNDLGPVESHD